MKTSKPLTSSTGRTARRLASAFLATTALALLPVAARAEAPASPAQESELAQLRAKDYSYPEEYKVEQTCRDWERVRRCVDAAGEVQYECAAKGPFAKLWARLHGRSEDDEVRVKVIRKAPEGSASVNEERETSGQKQVAGTGESHSKKVVNVKKGTLPACQDSQ